MKTVLEQCAKGNYQGVTHESLIELRVKLGDYALVAKILNQQVALIYKLKLSQVIKDEMLRDVRTLRTILEKSETTMAQKFEQKGETSK